MAITRSTAVERTRLSGNAEGKRESRVLELCLLVMVSLAIGAGLWFVYQARSAENAAGPEGADRGAVVNLNRVRTPDQLLPLLDFLPRPQDRIFAAGRIYQFVRDQDGIDSIGDLRLVRYTASQVRRLRGLERYALAPAERRKAQSEPQPGPFELLTASDLQYLRPNVTVRDAGESRRLLLINGFLFFGAFYALHVLWTVRHFGGDRLLLPIVHFLSGFGFIMMLRLRDPLRDAPLFPDFAWGVAAGCLFAFVASLPDYERSKLQRLVFTPLLVSFGLSLILFAFGSGPGASDAKVNLRLGPVLVQPVELIKLLLVLFLAAYFSSRWEFLRHLREPRRALPRALSGFDIPNIRYAAPLASAVALAIVFFFLQRDLGPALVFTLLFLILYGVARRRAVGALAACCVLVATFWAGYTFETPRTVASRVAIWLAPWDNFVRRGGDHLAHSLWAFSTGGVFGTGLGLGEPQTVPAVHTDLILSALGEELGFAGLLAIYLAYGLLIHRAFRISLSSRGSFAFFLGLALALLIGLQVAFISAGILGLVPLSGVVTPFLNYGKSSAVVNFVMIGILASLSAHPASERQHEPFRKPVLWAAAVLVFAAAAIVAQAARVQVFTADRILVRGALVPQADGHRRFEYNPRILEAARSIPRGTIFDRNGLPMASSSAPLVESFAAQYQQLGIKPEAPSAASGTARIYPFGPLAFHLLGDEHSRVNWAAPNTSFVERDNNATLQGYDDRALVVRVLDRPGGPEHAVVRRDFTELVPLVRYRFDRQNLKVKEITERKRDLRLSIDMRLQLRVANILRKHIQETNTERGAAVILDPATGYLLASVTYPYAGVTEAAEAAGTDDDLPESTGDSLLDRPRYGLYPPGSAFKLVTSIAALEARSDVENLTYDCVRLPDGRVGNHVRGWSRPARDDIEDKTPHGAVNLAKGLIVSCNAYFAQLGTYVVGADALLRAADLFGIRVAAPNTPTQLKDALPQASYGQGQVVATPMQMARVAAAIGNGGSIVAGRWVLEPDSSPAGRPAFTPEHARILSEYMRRVVTEGTGRAAQSAGAPIAGKTGTAELKDRPSHAWFVGFAPYRPGARKIAFAVIIENGRYGGRAAAPAAAEIVTAATGTGLIGRE
jgi:cell division protein FtsW (lipid II flippase)